MAVGVENYLTGIKPAPVRWMLSLGGIDPNKEQGIRELEQTAAHGDLLKPFAKLLLAVAALRDKNNSKGVICCINSQLPIRATLSIVTAPPNAIKPFHGQGESIQIYRTRESPGSHRS